MMEIDSYILKIYRGQPGKQYWEEFELEWKPGANVISGLMEIQRNPINRKGEKVEPVVWEQGCLEEVCGSCSMLVNSFPRQACTALIESIVEKSGSTTILLAPFSKFPLVRDLIVDRTRMFDGLKRVHAWLETDGSFERGFGQKISQKKQEVLYSYSKCMTCGCCVEACPQVNDRSKFVGPQVVAQAYLFNLIDPFHSDERLAPLMGEGGLEDCGNAQNCVKVCPKNVPLTDAIGATGRDLTLKAIKDLLSSPERNN